MINKEQIKAEIRASEDSFKALFSKKIIMSDSLIKWQDETLPDMYDHNSFVAQGGSAQVTTAKIDEMIKYQRNLGADFMKLELREDFPLEMREELKESRGIDGGETYTMYLPSKEISKWKTNPDVVIKDIQTDDIRFDIMEIERENYVKNYGEDFLVRKVNRYLDTAAKTHSLHYLGAFLDGKIAGACYCFEGSDGYVQTDNLIVNESVRNRYVATTLLYYGAKNFAGTMYLHADADDIPKDMYKKMGFEVIDSLFEYLYKES